VPTVTLNPAVVTWTPSPIPSPTPTLTLGEHVLVMAGDEGVILADQTTLYLLFDSVTGETQIRDSVTLDAGTRVVLQGETVRTLPELPGETLRLVEVAEGPRQGDQGWLKQSVLETAIPATPFVVAIQEGGVRVRAGDSTDYPIIGVLSAGQSAVILGVSSRGWYRIELADGARGWVAPGVVTVVGDVEGLPLVNPPPRPTPRPTQTAEEAPVDTAAPPPPPGGDPGGEPPPSGGGGGSGGSSPTSTPEGEKQ
jgi:hypothetical protein